MKTFAEFAARFIVKTEVECADSNPVWRGWGPNTNHYSVKLTGPYGTMTLPYSKGAALISEPTAEEVIECLYFDEHLLRSGEAEEMRVNTAGIKQNSEGLRRILGDGLFEDFINTAFDE